MYMCICTFASSWALQAILYLGVLAFRLPATNVVQKLADVYPEATQESPSWAFVHASFLFLFQLILPFKQYIQYILWDIPIFFTIVCSSGTNKLNRYLKTHWPDLKKLPSFTCIHYSHDVFIDEKNKYYFCSLFIFISTIIVCMYTYWCI